MTAYNPDTSDFAFTIEVEMRDGSIASIKGFRMEAFILTVAARDRDLRDACRVLAKETQTHYENQTVPVTGGGAIPWTDAPPGAADDTSYRTHADLAPEVLYPVIRSTLLRLLFIEETAENDLEHATSPWQNLADEEGVISVDFEDSWVQSPV